MTDSHNDPTPAEAEEQRHLAKVLTRLEHNLADLDRCASTGRTIPPGLTL